MVTPAARPGAGVGQRRAAVGSAATATAGAAAALVVLVVAQLEEPDQPDDQRADVEYAQPDHEDPARQRHSTANTTSVSPLVKSVLTPRRDRAHQTGCWCTIRRPSGPSRVVASIAIHSPSGSRSRWMPSSTLMNTHSCQSSTWRDAAGGVGHHQQALERGGRLAADERDLQARPARRRAGGVELAVGEAPVERGVVGDRLGPELRQRALAGGRRGRGRVGLAEPVRQLERLGAQAPRAQPHERVAALGVEERRLDLLDVAPGAHGAGLDPVRRERDGAEDVVGEPAGLAGLDPARAARRRGPAARRAARRAGSCGPTARGSGRWGRTCLRRARTGSRAAPRRRG